MPESLWLWVGFNIFILVMLALFAIVAIVGGAVVRRHHLKRIAHVGLVGIGLRPDATGLGLGRALMLALIEWSRRVGISRLELDVLADNHRAIMLYTSLGFRSEGRRRRHVRDPDGRERDDLLMGLLLDEPGPHTPAPGAPATAAPADAGPRARSGGASSPRRRAGAPRRRGRSPRRR